ncbi:MAG: C45 family peptidase, partial [Bacteroidales bacterium]|nr:C45 family peptidase [Bacteroidales bacterium]
ACSTVIISGKYTSDGRPILWKHRDTGTPNNKLVWLKDGKLRAIALIDSDDARSNNIWIGFNSAGFAIMNSASYNLKGSDTTSLTDQEGILMKAALMSCSTVDEFEQFLKNYKKPRGVEANFGVIDASGGAAYFETDNFNYTKIDVNDRKVAPHGYVVRTNYSFTGAANAGSGYIRYETAENLFYRASGSNNLNVPYMIDNMCRSLENSYSGQGISDFLNLDEKQDNFIYFQDCINRFSTSSSVIIQGVKPDEAPEFTTMWAIIGFPLSSLPVPVWLTQKGTLPELVKAGGKDNSELSDLSLILKNRMVPSQRSETKYYINTTKIANAQGTGITQKLKPVSDEIIRNANEKLSQWRKSRKMNQGEIEAFYNWTDSYIRKGYSDLFNLRIQK